MAEQLALIPFGRYTGKSIAALGKNDAYRNWLQGQHWFREQFAELDRALTQHFGPPADTPEHNEMQARFLLPEHIDDVIAPFVSDRNKLATLAPRFETDFDLDIISTKYDGEPFFLHIELKTSLGDDYPAVLRQIIANKEKCFRRQRSDIKCPCGHSTLLLVRHYEAGAATWDQVRAIFATQRVRCQMENRS